MLNACELDRILFFYEVILFLNEFCISILCVNGSNVPNKRIWLPSINDMTRSRLSENYNRIAKYYKTEQAYSCYLIKKCNQCTMPIKKEYVFVPFFHM